MLRVVFDSECNKELRCRVGVMYEWTYVVSVGITECGSVVAAIYATVEEPIESTDDTAFCAAHIRSKRSAVVTAFWLSYRAAIA